jgi:protein-S-isoprenylcysteine O-methyltransferase Ste14
MQRLKIRLGNFFFRYRNALFPVAFMFALMAGRPEHALGTRESDAIVDKLGFAVAMIGQSLRVATIGFEYIVRGGKDHQVHADTLVQGGIFAHCRNPLYVGNLLIVFGLALVIHSRAFYLIFIPFILLVYTTIVAAEEAYLHDKFGAEYDLYCSRVPRWRLRLRGLVASVRPMRFNWQRVLVKEYNTTFALMAALVGLSMWSDFRVLGPGALPQRGAIVVGALLWAGLYFAVRTAKKSGYLRG